MHRALATDRGTYSAFEQVSIEGQVGKAVWRIPLLESNNEDSLNLLASLKAKRAYHVGALQMSAGPGQVLSIPSDFQPEAYLEGEAKYNPYAYCQLQLSAASLSRRVTDILRLLKADETPAAVLDFLFSGAGEIQSERLVRAMAAVNDATAAVLDPNADSVASYDFILSLEQAVEILTVESLRRMRVRKSDPPRAAVSTAAAELIRLAAEHLRVRLDENVSLEDLRELTGLSPTHLRRGFQAEYGQSPSEFVSAQRLIYALELLDNPRLNISEVAHRCGFGSVAAFTHFFVRQTGKSPSEHRVTLPLGDG